MTGCYGHCSQSETQPNIMAIVVIVVVVVVAVVVVVVVVIATVVPPSPLWGRRRRRRGRRRRRRCCCMLLVFAVAAAVLLCACTFAGVLRSVCLPIWFKKCNLFVLPSFGLLSALYFMPCASCSCRCRPLCSLSFVLSVSAFCMDSCCPLVAFFLYVLADPSATCGDAKLAHN